MNKKTLIILIILFIVLVGFILGYFLIFKKYSTQQNTQNKIEKNEFIINLPEGWEEVETIAGSAATVVRSKEQINNTDAQKIGFRSYYSVVHDISSEKEVSIYLQNMRDSLAQAFPNIKFFNKESTTTDGNPVYYIEADLNQQNIDFKTLLAVQIKNDDVWIISFNTLKENWGAYQNSFYQVAENFKIK